MEQHDEQVADEAIEAGPTDVVTAGASRRSFVTKGAIAAAVGAAAGVAMKSPVNAANGSTMYVGETDIGTDTTHLTGGTTFQVSGGGSAGSASIYGTNDGTGKYAIRGDFTGMAAGSAGVYGYHSDTSVGGPGVRGESELGDGVYGIAGTDTQSSGVYGTASGSRRYGVRGRGLGTEATGVRGEAVAGVGVHGIADSGIGVRGEGTSADLVAAGSGVIRLSAAASTDIGATSSGSVGSLARNSDGSLWYCYGSSTWQKVGGGSTAGAFHPVTPFRAYDSRPVAAGPGPIAAGTSRVVGVKDSKNPDGTVLLADAVPSGATAIAFNLTLVATTGRGFLSVADGEAAASGASTINWSSAGVNLANGSTVVISASREVKVFCGPEGSTNFILDVTGYYL